MTGGPESTSSCLLHTFPSGIRTHSTHAPLDGDAVSETNIPPLLPISSTVERHPAPPSERSAIFSGSEFYSRVHPLRHRQGQSYRSPAFLLPAAVLLPPAGTYRPPSSPVLPVISQSYDVRNHSYPAGNVRCGRTFLTVFFYRSNDFPLFRSQCMPMLERLRRIRYFSLTCWHS